MVYITSDIHGHSDCYNRLLEKINLTENDCLIILGDVVDRGENGVEILLDIMKSENVFLLLGNHEQMMLEVLEKLSQEITEENIAGLTAETTDRMVNWLYENDGEPTLNAFKQLSNEKKAELLDFIACLPLYEELSVNGQTYVLVHAGLGDNFSPDKPLDDYYDDELIWSRTDYSMQYYSNKILITGHTPTRIIEGNPKHNFIFKGNNHIAIDCGCGFEGGQLGCICLNTMEEFYVK